MKNRDDMNYPVMILIVIFVFALSALIAVVDAGQHGASTCSRSGLTELAPDGSILTVTGPATIEDATTGKRTIIPAGETWRSVPSGWERVPCNK